MAINSMDAYLASSKQRLRIFKTTTRTVVAGMPFTLFDVAGIPAAGTLAGTNTANGGVVQTDEIAGYPTIGFTTGTGYLSKVEFGSTVACRLSVFDVLLKMGAITFAAQTVTPTDGTQPNISGRCPDYPGSGSTFGAGMELWLEVSTAFATGTSWNIAVTYKNQNGTSGRVASFPAVLGSSALSLGRWQQLQLQGADTGIQRIEAITVTNNSTAMTAGAFNLLIVRPLWTNGRARMTNDGDIHDLLKTGMPVVYTDSALTLLVEADLISSGNPELVLEIANG